MGKITDSAIAIIVIIIGFVIFARLGITMPIVIKAFSQFFGGS